MQNTDNPVEVIDKIISNVHVPTNQSIPWWLSSKESAWNAGAVGSISGSGRSPGEGHTTHPSTLAWRIPWTEEPHGLQSMGLDMTEVTKQQSCPGTGQSSSRVNYPRIHFLNSNMGSGDQVAQTPSSQHRVPGELWMEVHDIVQEAGIKTMPKKKKCKKAKWLSEEALQIVVKRREAKNKGEKETYTHLDAEFQRIARWDKKAFLSDQYKEIEENNWMGKTRYLLK